MDKSQLKEFIKSKSIENIIAALSDTNMEVRTLAASALSKIGDKRAVNPLIAALNDITDYPVVAEPLQAPISSIDARGEAALALGKIGGKNAIEALKTATDTKTKQGYYRGLSVGEAVKKAHAELGIIDNSKEEDIENINESTSEEMLQKANELRDRGNIEEALEWAKRSADKDPSNGIAWMLIGILEVNRREVVSAIKAFVSAINADSSLKGSEPGSRLAVIYDHLGMKSALDDIRSSLTIAGLMLDPSAEREWKQLIAGIDLEKLQSAISLPKGKD